MLAEGDKKPAPPLESEFANTDFVLFGEENWKKSVYIKSKSASLELLGSYPLEAIEVSPGAQLGYFLEITTGLCSSDHNWVMSRRAASDADPRGTGKLVLIWSGLSSNEDRLGVKKILDRNALDITTSVMNGDFWAAMISVAPVIAECRRAHRKGVLLRKTIWLGALAFVALLLFGALYSLTSSGIPN